MKTRRSLVGHVLKNNFLVIIIAVTLGSAILFANLCSIYRTRVINDARTVFNETGHELRFEIESAIQQTDILVKNEHIMQGLDTDFTKNYIIIDFLDNLTSFVNGLEETEYWEINRFIIYSENPTLVSSGYVKKSSVFPKFQSVKKESKEGLKRYYWKEDIGIDEFGRSYLTLYRYVPMKYDCIMELKVFVNEVYPKDNIYNIKLDVASRLPDEEDSLSMRQNIMEGFELSCNIDKAILTAQYIRYLVLLIACVLAFLAVTYLITATSAKKAMKDMLSLIAEIEGGDILTSGEDERWHEVAVVKNKIGDLTNRLYRSGVREYENELKRRKLEIEILNAKINPHLIYNSLSVIKLVAYREKCLDICDATDILVNYYRLVLNKGEDTISVALELEYMEKYIGIYKISKKFNYEVDYDVCEDAFDIMIPHMMLQPVLENALIHGLKNPQNARISIMVYCEDEKLYIKMSDNGIGIDESKLKRLNERKDLGYGLKSVIQRADYFYDGDFDFSIESEKGKGTTVSLTVPKNIRKLI